MTTMADLSYTERLEVEQLAKQIVDGPGVATIDLTNYQGGTGKRHKYREPLARLVGSRIEYGIDRDDDGNRFGWFTRYEEPISEETRLARERLGFSG